MKTQLSITKIFVVRNDRLGDFMLIYPVLALLKQYINHIHITVLIPQYTSDIAKVCPWIDDIIVDSGSNATFSEQYTLLKKIRKKKFDAIITLYSTPRIGLLAFLAKIKYRLAPATKIAQIFYNHRLTQRRSRSLKPEYEYNLDLGIKYLTDLGLCVKELPKAPFLQFNDKEVNDIRADFCEKNNIDINSKLILIHPGTGGSATNLDLKQYANLAKNLKIDNRYVFVITAGPDELQYAKNLSLLLKDTAHVIYHSTEGLDSLSKIIQLCDLFISGSTGPLHIAGALNRPTAAFYQRRRSATPLRWQTLNTEERRLAFTPPENEGESDMQKVDIAAAASAINIKFLKN